MRPFFYMFLYICMLVMGLGAASVYAQEAPALETVAKFSRFRPGNPAVAPNGDLYLTQHPMDNPFYRVVKMNGNKAVPFPDRQWSIAPNQHGIGIAATIGIEITAGNELFVLDMGSPESTPKLVVWDLAANKLSHIYYVPMYVRTPNSFLQDFAVDAARRYAYIADMGRADLIGEETPAIVVIDLASGQMRRVLANHPTVRAGTEPLKAAGKTVEIGPDGEKVPLHLGVNPIAIDPQNEWVYYGPMAAGYIYRIRSADLANFALNDQQLSRKIERYGPKPSSDGIAVDGQGNVYVTDVDRNAIGITTKDHYRIYIEDPALSWPDGLAIAGDSVYVTVNQLHLADDLNAGEEKGVPPYFLMKFKAVVPAAVH